MACASGIPWPRLESGALSLADDTFKDMARTYPVLTPLRELRSSLSKLRLNKLAVGRDGRNRVGIVALQRSNGSQHPE